MNRSISPKKALIGAALVGATLTGAAVGATLITPASAQTPTTATTSASGTPATAPDTARDPHVGGHQANGITETLLTGDTLAKATAAANAAVPGGTIERAETDAEGAAYEVHMLDKSGAPVTVKLDSSFKATVEQGGPGQGHGGPPPAQGANA